MRVEVVAHRAHDRVAQQHRVAHARRGAGRACGGAGAASRRPGRPRRPGTAASRTRRAASAAATSSSISPVARFGLTLPASRRTTCPAAEITCSGRSRSAAACASPRAVSGWKTSCTSPVRSRRSMKISPPWSRRRCTQPATRTVSPTRAASSSPHQASRYSLARGGLTGSPCAMWCMTVPVSTSLLLSRLHVLQRRALVAEDRNVAGARAVGLLELALERAAGRARVAPRGPRGGRRPRAGTRRRAARAWRRRRTGRAAAPPRARASRRAGSARRRPPSPCPASAGRRSARSARRSGRRRRRPTARRGRRR